MTYRKKENRIQGRTTAYYSLAEVKKLVKAGNVLIREKPQKSARDDFGWDFNDILDALKKLQVKHFYKSEEFFFEPKIPVDY